MITSFEVMAKHKRIRIRVTCDFHFLVDQGAQVHPPKVEVSIGDATPAKWACITDERRLSWIPPFLRLVPAFTYRDGLGFTDQWAEDLAVALSLFLPNYVAEIPE